MNSNFQIINASAGSGKTFSLVQNILKELFISNEESYKRILALTFTNNAANEMKKRILEELIQIADDINSSEMFKLLNKDLNIEKRNASQKAKRIVNKILHNFSFFQVSTIDKFNHRIIRAFSQDLSLSSDFDLIIDQDEFRDQLVNEFLDNLDESKLISSILTDFSLDKIKDNNSWDISYDLSELMKLLLSEVNIDIVSKSELLEKKNFFKFKNFISKKLIELKKKSILNSKLLIDLCNENFNNSKAFSRNALPNFLTNIISGNVDKKKIDSILKRFENNTILKKEFVDQNLDFLEKAQISITKIIDILQKILVYESIKKNNTQNHIIQELKNFSYNFQKENNILLISEFNNLISENIADQPAPFIYEKIGNRFKNYFIDEFQDTSSLQWRNIIPLTSHAIEAMDEDDLTGTLFIVGDPKQSLYRWRGADPEIFKSILNKKTPFYVEPYIRNLEDNFRSSFEIVKFNNNFFSYIKNKIQLKEAQDTFSSFIQNHTKKNSGHVSISFLENNLKDDNYKKATLIKVLEIISERNKQNISLNQIAILLRSNDECSLVSDFLLENNINVTSEDMLSIENSVEISFLINLLKTKNEVKNTRIKFEILKFLSFKEDECINHDYINKNITRDIYSIFDNFLKLSFSIFKKLDLYDSIEYVVNNTNLFNQKLIYVQALLDLILDYNISNKKFKESFFEYWERKKNKTKISPPQDLNAVKVLTIHKSKGLQFPVTILPFFDSKLSKSSFKTWVELNENEFSKQVLIQFSSSMNYFSKKAKAKYELIQSNMITDSLNLMYVAMTRAQNESYIISKVSVDENQNTFSKLLYNFVLNNYPNKFKSNEIRFGNLKELKINNSSNKTIYELENFKRKENLEIDKYVFSNKTENSSKGEAFHLIMEKIIYDYQYQKVLDEFYSVGLINENELKSFRKLIKQIVNHLELKEFFNSENKVFNEREIYLSSGEVIRPDKILFHNDKVVSILDYKTGLKKSQDIDQLNKYISYLSRGGYKIKKALLVYTKDNLELLNLV